MKTRISAGRVTSMDTTALAIRYEFAGSAVSRSCRFQPVCRSMATRAPVLMAAPMQPNEAIETIR